VSGEAGQICHDERQPPARHDMTEPDPNLKYVLREMPDTAREFYARLERGELAATRCGSCGELRFPPRWRCPACGERTRWEPLSRRGSVYAFTQQERGLAFTAPDVIGIVELEEGVRVFGVFEQSLDRLAVGAPVEVVPREHGSGLTLLAFRLR
jgi:uncharacterized OB-fold protein